MLNKEQYERLKLYEYKLTQAYKGRNLVGMGQKAINELISLYNDIYNRNEIYTNCPKCLFNIVFKLGEEYFKYKEIHANDPVEPEEFIEVEMANGEVATMANSEPRIDADGNEIRLKSIEEDNAQKMREVKESKKNKNGKGKK